MFDLRDYHILSYRRTNMRLRMRLEVSPGDSSLVQSNEDLEPIPRDSPKRTWAWPSLLGFWIAEAFSISMYQGKLTRMKYGVRFTAN